MCVKFREINANNDFLGFGIVIVWNIFGDRVKVKIEPVYWAALRVCIHGMHSHGSEAGAGGGVQFMQVKTYCMPLHYYDTHVQG